MHQYISSKFTRVEKIDYPFIPQRMPSILDDSYEENCLDDVNKFLADDDSLIKRIMSHPYYPIVCGTASYLIAKHMRGSGLSVATVRGVFNVYSAQNPFPFGYVDNFDPALSSMRDYGSHVYVVGKVDHNGVVNEVIFDYTADQFRYFTIGTIETPIFTPLIAPRDEVRSIYLTLRKDHPRRLDVAEENLLPDRII